MHTDHITIGRNATLTFDILQAVVKRAAREDRKQARRERIRKLLTFWKREND